MIQKKKKKPQSISIKSDACTLCIMGKHSALWESTVPRSETSLYNKNSNIATIKKS